MGLKSLPQAWCGVAGPGDLALEQQGFHWWLVRLSRSLVLRARSLGPEQALAILWRRLCPLWLFFPFLMWKAAEPAGDDSGQCYHEYVLELDQCEVRDFQQGMDVVYCHVQDHPSLGSDDQLHSVSPCAEELFRVLPAYSEALVLVSDG
eukprot:2832650-Rhodomonas_salina.2